MTHTKSNILQYNACLPKLRRRQEYYPFGLQTASSWTREGSSNSYLYNEASELNQNSGWYETFFRGYDPTLGRFHQVDPLAYASSSHTPYNYAYNDPVFYNDPNGDYVEPTLRSDKPVTYDWTSVMIAGGMDGFSNVVSHIYGGSPIPGEGYFGSSASNFIDRASKSQYGGSWSRGEGHLFTSYQEALAAGTRYNDEHNSWRHTSSNNKTYQASSVHNKYRFRWRNGKPKYVGLNTVVQQGGLNFKTLWGDYGDGLSHTDKDGKEIFGDYCAINLSEALIKSGMSPEGTKCWGNCSSKQSHTIRAQELATWLQGNLSGVKVLTGANFEEYISGKTGIVFFQDYWQRQGESGTTGDHIDLWNKNEMGSYGVFDTWLRTTIPWLGPLRGMSDLSKSTQVLFWEIK